MPLSPENISIDVVNTLIYCIALFRIAQAFYFNHLSTQQRVILSVFTVLGAIFIFQTLNTVQTATTAPPTVWDIYNFIHIMLALAIVSLIKDKTNIS